MRVFLVATAISCTVFCAAQAEANSCANVYVIGTFDESGLIFDSSNGIYTAGTFRIADESDESRQPMFNLAMLTCENRPNGTAGQNFECKVTKAVVRHSPDKPDTEKPNCSLDLEITEYSMKELQRGVLTGADSSTSCFRSVLTIDRNTKRVYLSFMRTEYADNYDKIKLGACGALPRTQVMMNCTAWPRIRNPTGTPTRYCDFSNSTKR